MLQAIRDTAQLEGILPLSCLGICRKSKKMRDEAFDTGFNEITHDIVDHLLPDRKFYADKYGKIRVIWFGYVTENLFTRFGYGDGVLSKKAGHFWKEPPFAELEIDWKRSTAMERIGHREEKLYLHLFYWISLWQWLGSS